MAELDNDRLSLLLVADLAHQLRTQIQLLTIRLERLSVHIAPEGAAVRNRVMADVARFTGTLNELLDLHNSIKSVSMAEVDVCEVVRERAEAWSDIAAFRELVIHAVAGPPAVILTREGTLEQVLDILLDNAVKNSQPEGRITVAVSIGDGTVTIQVIDGGPGMTAEERVLATRRGWRGGDRTDDSGSHGLGLSIASRLTNSNGGRLELHPGLDGRGLSAQIQFALLAPMTGTGDRPLA